MYIVYVCCHRTLLIASKRWERGKCSLISCFLVSLDNKALSSDPTKIAMSNNALFKLQSLMFVISAVVVNLSLVISLRLAFPNLSLLYTRTLNTLEG